MQATYVLQRGTRMGLSVSLGAIVTGLLLIWMCSLIAMDFPDIVETTTIRPAVVMDPPKPIEVRPDERVEKPKEVERDPVVPDMPTTFDHNPDVGGSIRMPPPIMDGGTGIQGPDSRSAIATFTVAPPYPNRAVRRNIEGYVDLLFDITATGKPENIRILNAQPQGYFESSSVRTLKKWRYKPALEEGVAIAQKNKTTRIKFELDK